jgi:LPXTG-motif cell wall-anchored protein
VKPNIPMRAIGLLAVGLVLAFLVSALSLGGPGDTDGPRFDTNDDIAFAQKILVSENLLRSGGFARGQMDGETFQAVLAFQRDHTIKPTGFLDFETMAMLSSHEQSPRRARLEPAPGPIRVAENVEPLQKVETPAPEPAPAPVTEPAAAAPPAPPAPVVRTMPKTSSPIPLLAGLGVLLVAGGALLLRRANQARTGVGDLS